MFCGNLKKIIRRILNNIFRKLADFIRKYHGYKKPKDVLGFEDFTVEIILRKI